MNLMNIWSSKKVALINFLKLLKRKIKRLPFIWWAVKLKRAPVGKKKVVLANHMNPIVRRLALSSLGAEVAEDCQLNQGIRIVMDYPETSKLIVGKRVSVAPGVHFICNSGPHPNSLLHQLSIAKNDLIKQGSIVVSEDSWIGANAIILPGVKIGRGCVIGAGALVLKDTEDFSVVAGVPAKKMRNIRGDVSEEYSLAAEGWIG